LLILTIRGLNSKGKIRISGKNIGVAFGGNDRFRKIAIARQWIAGIPGAAQFLGRRDGTVARRVIREFLYGRLPSLLSSGRQADKLVAA
jgi:hypothetical protein